MVERLGKMRKGKRESIEKGSREKIEKEKREKRERDKRELRKQFEVEEGLKNKETISQGQVTQGSHKYIS